MSTEPCIRHAIPPAKMDIFSLSFSDPELTTQQIHQVLAREAKRENYWASSFSGTREKGLAVGIAYVVEVYVPLPEASGKLQNTTIKKVPVNTGRSILTNASKSPQFAGGSLTNFANGMVDVQIRYNLGESSRR